MIGPAKAGVPRSAVVLAGLAAVTNLEGVVEKLWIFTAAEPAQKPRRFARASTFIIDLADRRLWEHGRLTASSAGSIFCIRIAT
ncbi:hypothetical protein [Amycolatopsis saalfeldensis]|uniref:hypothetical protein n=1 Tax=Amycolatopsis saalfeldensis TaxID=394193 RepID=UPI000B870029|nr:hypothetical protein [Amycolatopsis saalfeldensis]